MKKQKKNSKTPAEPAVRVHRRRKTEPPAIDASFKGDEFKDPPDEAENITPLTYLNLFEPVLTCLKLKNMGILTTATARKDRIGKCPLESTAQMTESGRGSLDYRVDLNTGLRIVKWLDNGEVHMVPTYDMVDSLTEVQRWDKKKNTHISISCPSVVKSYNSPMGGVDLFDMFLALFRTKINIKRWYVKMFFHFVEIAKVIGWLLYKHYHEQNKVQKKKHDVTFRVH